MFLKSSPVDCNVQPGLSSPGLYHLVPQTALFSSSYLSTQIALCPPSAEARTAFQFNSVQLHSIQLKKYLFNFFSTLHFWLYLPREWWDPCFPYRTVKRLEFILVFGGIVKKILLKHWLQVTKDYALDLDIKLFLTLKALNVYIFACMQNICLLMCLFIQGMLLSINGLRETRQRA